MLYDKRWDKTETKPDVFSLESLIAWLETMPAKKEYDYWDCKGACLYGQYTAGHDVPWKDSGHYDQRGTARGDFSETVYEIAIESPRTFGAALSRARIAQHGGT